MLQLLQVRKPSHKCNLLINKFLQILSSENCPNNEKTRRLWTIPFTFVYGSLAVKNTLPVGYQNNTQTTLGRQLKKNCEVWPLTMSVMIDLMKYIPNNGVLWSPAGCVDLVVAYGGRSLWQSLPNGSQSSQDILQGFQLPGSRDNLASRIPRRHVRSLLTCIWLQEMDSSTVAVSPPLIQNSLRSTLCWQAEFLFCPPIGSQIQTYWWFVGS